MARDRKELERLAIERASLSSEERAQVLTDAALRGGDQALVEAAAKLAEDSFRRVWDNPDDAAYDAL